MDAMSIDMDPGTIAAPTNMVPESGGQCGNALDDDGDFVADDGCLAAAFPGPSDGETYPTDCFDSLDNDADTVVDDGCGPSEWE
jgi:hypothetical protein